jgi:hypothetical protein
MAGAEPLMLKRFSTVSRRSGVSPGPKRPSLPSSGLRRRRHGPAVVALVDCVDSVAEAGGCSEAHVRLRGRRTHRCGWLSLDDVHTGSSKLPAVSRARRSWAVSGRPRPLDSNQGRPATTFKRMAPPPLTGENPAHRDSRHGPGEEDISRPRTCGLSRSPLKSKILSGEV